MGSILDFLKMLDPSLQKLTEIIPGQRDDAVLDIIRMVDGIKPLNILSLLSDIKTIFGTVAAEQLGTALKAAGHVK